MSIPVAILTRSCNASSGGWPSDLRSWLSAAERDEHARLRHAPRRVEWLAGRWLLKRMLQDRLLPAGDISNESLLDIVILSRDARGRGASPRALIDGRALAGHISLAHHDGDVWAAVSPTSEIRVGIDVVAARPVNRRVSSMWYTPREREWLARWSDHMLGAAVWAAKEAVYKATNFGEPFSPALCEICEPLRDAWTWTGNGSESWLDVRHLGGQFVAAAAVRMRHPKSGASHD